MEGVICLLRYIYDGSFDGFLSVIHACYYIEEPDCIERRNSYTYDLLYEDKVIETDITKSNKVHTAILEKISEDTLIHVYRGFLSEKATIEIKILKYIQLGFRLGSRVNDLLSNEIVSEVQKYSARVAREVHSFLGLIRFQEFRGVLYAAIEPTYNIIELLGNHFKERLTNEKWIIHDVKRKTGIVYEFNEWIFRDLKFEKLESQDVEELFYQNLWRVFHKTIAIKERCNERLQMQHMPKKYWNNLIEMKQ